MRTNRRKTTIPIPSKLTTTSTKNKAAHIAINADKEKISSDVYRGKQRRRGKTSFKVQEELCSLYFNKCAYCEDIEAYPEVEHYRPKKAVTEESKHPGYYWLCYEWSNLLPTCHSCNTVNGKKNQFPIRGTRVMLPTIQNGVWDESKNDPTISPLADELPYLLNPELDTPDDGSYFEFGINGSMKGIDLDKRGQKTVDICDLDRDTLRIKRQRIIDDIVIRLNDLFTAYLEDRISPDENFLKLLELIFERINDKTKPQEPFSLFADYLYKNFDNLVLPLIPTSIQRAIIKQEFDNYNNVS